MNLLQSDVLNARRVLQDIGIDPGKVWSGWHEGSISVIVTCSPGQKDRVFEILNERTSINIPIVVEEDFTPSGDLIGKVIMIAYGMCTMR